MKSQVDKKTDEHNNSTPEPYSEEDPTEVYKREFQRKRWEKEQQEKQHALKWNSKIHAWLRTLAFPILAFAFTLVLDSIVPPNIISEKGLEGWQRGYGRRSRVYTSYIQTQSFIVAVPNEIHVNYPYYAENKPPLIIEVSPLFKIPKQVTVTIDNVRYVAMVGETIFHWIPFHYLLLISSVLAIWKKNYSWTSYIFSSATVILMCLVALRWLQSEGLL
jgi:hypothetical protein